MLDQPVPNPVASNPNIHTHKVFATVGLILIGLIIAVGGIWWYVSSQGGFDNEEADTATTKTSTSSANKATTSAEKAKTNETANWKTYTSSTYTISFKYPTDWEVVEQPNISQVKSVLYLGVRPTSLDEDYAQNIIVFTSSIADVKNYYTNTVFTNSTLVSETNTTVDAIAATKLNFQNKSDSKVKPSIILVQKGNFVYSINGCCSGPTESDEKITETIITTFKFL